MLHAIAKLSTLTFAAMSFVAAGMLLGKPDTKVDAVVTPPAIEAPAASPCSCGVCTCTNCDGNCENTINTAPQSVEVAKIPVEQLAAAPGDRPVPDQYAPQVIEYTAAGIRYRVTDGHTEVFATQCFDDNGDGRYDRCEPAAWRSWYDLPKDQRLKLYRGDNAAATKQQQPAYRERSQLLPRIQNTSPPTSYRRSTFFRRPRSATRSCSSCG